MSKMGDMAMTIEDLRNAAAAINDAADWLSRQFSGEPAVAEPAPAKEPELKLEDVRAVLVDMSRKGHTAEIRALLQKYGAAKLSGVDPANYSALLKDVEGLDHALNTHYSPRHHLNAGFTARRPQGSPRAMRIKEATMLPKVPMPTVCANSN